MSSSLWFLYGILLGLVLAPGFVAIGYFIALKQRGSAKNPQLPADGFLKDLEAKASVEFRGMPRMSMPLPGWASKGQAEPTTQQPFSNTLPAGNGPGSTE